MSEVKYSKEHEWIKIEGDVGTIGITQHATEMLGDIVFVELPDVGASVEKDGNAGVVESTKAASDVYTPISGEIMENNQIYDYKGDTLLHFRNKAIPQLREKHVTDNNEQYVTSKLMLSLGTLSAATLIVFAIMLARE